VFDAIRLTGRRSLAITLPLVGVGCIATGAYLLAMTLCPDLARQGDATVELDVAGLGPGELRTFATWEGEFWVLRRTPAQIENLGHRPAAVASETQSEADSSVSRNSLRSADPTFFVFRVQRLGDGIMLRQYPDQYLVCSDLRLFQGARSYPGGQVITDGFSCADDPQIAYDLAGIPASPYLAELDVPEHNVRRGRILLTPDP
jgi:hypothetical protein